jgi:hypothetical protein
MFLYHVEAIVNWGRCVLGRAPLVVLMVARRELPLVVVVVVHKRVVVVVVVAVAVVGSAVGGQGLDACRPRAPPSRLNVVCACVVVIVFDRGPSNVVRSSNAE